MQYNETTQQIIDRLEDKDIDYEIFEHKPVTTSDEAAEVRENFSIEQGLKALVLKLYGADDPVPENPAKPEPRYGASFAMIVLSGDDSFSQHKVEKALNIDDFRFANESELDELLGEVEIGGIPPMGSLFDLETYADESIKDTDKVIFNAGDRRVSIAFEAGNYFQVEQPEVAEII